MTVPHEKARSACADRAFGKFGAEHQIRTGDLRLGNADGLRNTGSEPSSPVAKHAIFLDVGATPIVQPSHPSSPFRKDLGPTEVRAARHLHVAAAPPALLRVADVARILAVSTATVYALADRGALAHVRVMNAIRVSPADLATFMNSQRRTK